MHNVKTSVFVVNETTPYIQTYVIPIIFKKVWALVQGTTTK